MKKILCVDDSDTIRSQLREALSGAGFEALEAADGLKGLTQIRANPDIALIICDVNMPEMDGLTMCKKLKEAEDIQKKPVVLMLTTETSAELKAQGKEAGVLGWITKPFEAAKILAAVQKLTA